MWRSTFIPATIFRRSIRLKQTDRTCCTIQTHSDELNWARTFHELNYNSRSLIRLMKSSTFCLGRTYYITDISDNTSTCDAVNKVFGFWVFLRRQLKSDGSALPLIIIADLLGNRSLLQRVQKRSCISKGLWLVIGGFRSVLYVSVFLGSLLLNFRVRVFSRFRSFSSQVVFTFLLKYGKFSFPRWSCPYRASKSRRNADIGGRKLIDTSPPTFNFAASARYCRLYMKGTDWKLW